MQELDRSNVVHHVVLRGGMGRATKAVAGALKSIPDERPDVLQRVGTSARGLMMRGSIRSS